MNESLEQYVTRLRREAGSTPLRRCAGTDVTFANEKTVVKIPADRVCELVRQGHVLYDWETLSFAPDTW